MGSPYRPHRTGSRGRPPGEENKRRAACRSAPGSFVASAEATAGRLSAGRAGDALARGDFAGDVIDCAPSRRATRNVDHRAECDLPDRAPLVARAPATAASIAGSAKSGRSKPVTITADRRAIGDHGAGEMNEREIVLRDCFPPNAECSEIVVPAVCALDDPATRTTAFAPPRFLAAPTKMQPDTTAGDLARGIVVVIAFVEAEVPWPTRTARRTQRNSVECFAREPLVVDVGAGQRDCDGDAATVGEDVAFRAKLSTICRIGTSEAPPFGAFTEALRSHEAYSLRRRLP